ncbi:uncharacterized protein LOC123262190 isoform X2 [Cotesia glomerata]|uniref:uncharacterized protein LOC123262190 isoform X2 n=1 Tax=Cotesia glomerata TaxID=32391 RepID=UPI001D00F8DB|nr:uncharacterized protein LOC123262190 isoform X2 [Cotesia glomerata]
MYFNYIILIFFGSIINFVYNAYPSNVSIINNNVSDAPQDLRVEIFDEFGNINDDNSHDSVLKFNISWLPPYSWCPTSYSIFINSMTVDQKNTISCPEESIFYTTTTTTTDDNLFNIVLPENSLLSDVPELQIRPSCTYEIQVFANPRANANSNAAKINITVPNCIGKLCNCDEASKLLPSVEVNASIADSKSILISWSTIHQLLNASDISSFIVGYSIPILISKNGIPVYNLTKLTSAPSNARSYIWHTESSVNSIFDKEMKIFVAAEDIHGCRGRMSDYIIKTNAQPLLMSITYSNQWLIWSTVLIICSIIIGLFTYIRNRGHENYKFILSNHVTSGISSIRISERNGWINTVLKKKNMLYADEIIETTETITDGYEISYDRIKISSELGKGQFGKVYLGYLDFVTNNNNNNEGEENGFPVAVKMMNPGNVDDKTAARRQLVYEIGTMKRAGSHPHLVKLIGCCTKLENPICIILEYVEGGDLLGYLHQLRDSLNKKLTSTHSTSELCSNENATPEVRLIAPNYVKYNSTAELTCDHTVAPDDLHKVEFLKDNKKILEYIRDRTDPFRKSPPAGLEFEHSLDGKTIKLNDVHFDASGSYSCLVSSTYPIYTESSDEVKLQVIVPQSDNPHITFKKAVYTVGEVLEANCTSAPANPVPHLTWLINGLEVIETRVTTFPYRQHQKHLMSVESQLSIEVSDLHAGKNGHLEISCRATIPNYLLHQKDYADIRTKTVTVEIIPGPSPTTSLAVLPRGLTPIVISSVLCVLHIYN